MNRQRIYSGAPWEKSIGYCRATRFGDQVFVSGTTAMQDGQVVAPGDAAAQTRHILETIARVLTELETSFEDVMRVRIYVTNLSDTEAVTRELAEFIQPVHPAATLVAVSGLITDGLVVEIEADAIVGSASPLDKIPYSRSPAVRYRPAIAGTRAGVRHDS